MEFIRDSAKLVRAHTGAFSATVLATVLGAVYGYSTVFWTTIGAIAYGATITKETLGMWFLGVSPYTAGFGLLTTIYMITYVGKSRRFRLAMRKAKRAVTPWASKFSQHLYVVWNWLPQWAKNIFNGFVNPLNWALGIAFAPAVYGAWVGFSAHRRKDKRELRESLFENFTMRQFRLLTYIIRGSNIILGIASIIFFVDKANVLKDALQLEAGLNALDTFGRRADESVTVAQTKRTSMAKRKLALFKMTITSLDTLAAPNYALLVNDIEQTGNWLATTCEATYTGSHDTEALAAWKRVFDAADTAVDAIADQDHLDLDMDVEQSWILTLWENAKVVVQTRFAIVVIACVGALLIHWLVVWYAGTAEDRLRRAMEVPASNEVREGEGKKNAHARRTDATYAKGETARKEKRKEKDNADRSASTRKRMIRADPPSSPYDFIAYDDTDKKVRFPFRDAAALFFNIGRSDRYEIRFDVTTKTKTGYNTNRYTARTVQEVVSTYTTLMALKALNVYDEMRVTPNDLLEQDHMHSDYDVVAYFENTLVPFKQEEDDELREAMAHMRRDGIESVAVARTVAPGLPNITHIETEVTPAEKKIFDMVEAQVNKRLAEERKAAKAAAPAAGASSASAPREGKPAGKPKPQGVCSAWWNYGNCNRHAKFQAKEAGAEACKGTHGSADCNGARRESSLSPAAVADAHAIISLSGNPRVRHPSGAPSATALVLGNCIAISDHNWKVNDDDLPVISVYANGAWVDHEMPRAAFEKRQKMHLATDSDYYLYPKASIPALSSVTSYTAKTAPKEDCDVAVCAWNQKKQRYIPSTGVASLKEDGYLHHTGTNTWEGSCGAPLVSNNKVIGIHDVGGITTNKAFAFTDDTVAQISALSSSGFPTGL